MSNIARICGNCEWYRAFKHDDMEGQCFLLPPVLVAESMLGEPEITVACSRRPTVDSGDKCASWQLSNGD